MAYVGATRPKDDLLITFSANKPSEFLTEIALNPKFQGTETEELKHNLTSSKLRLEKAQVVLQQLETKKEKLVAFFYELTKTQPGKLPAWSEAIVWRIRHWRIDKTKERIEVTDRRIKKHVETAIVPLQKESLELEEETNMRVALGIKQA